MDDLKGTASYIPDKLDHTPESSAQVHDGAAGSPEYDVIIIGAGMSGVYMGYRMRELGFKYKVVEAGSAVGGTWFWNRYSMANFNSESY